MWLINDHCPVVLCQFLAQGNIYLEAVNQKSFYRRVHKHTGNSHTVCALLLLPGNDNTCMVLLLSGVGCMPFQHISQGVGAGVEDTEPSFAFFFHAEGVLLGCTISQPIG